MDAEIETVESARGGLAGAEDGKVRWRGRRRLARGLPAVAFGTVLGIVATSLVLRDGAPHHASDGRPAASPAHSCDRLLKSLPGHDVRLGRLPRSTPNCTTVQMPGTSSTYFDSPGPLTLTSYAVWDESADLYTAYLRDVETGRFVRTEYAWLQVSPDGERVVAVPRRPLPVNKVTIVGRAGGPGIDVPLPVHASAPQWSPDGKEILMTAWRDTTFEKRDVSLVGRRLGFVLIDTATGRARLVRAPDKPRHRAHESEVYRWTGDGSQIMLTHGTGVRYLDRTGLVQRTIAGTAAADETGLPTSPDGRRLMATGDDGSRVLDIDSGRELHTYSWESTPQGWYDDDHFIASAATTDPDFTFESVVDGEGTVIKHLLVTPGAEHGPAHLSFTRAAG